MDDFSVLKKSWRVLSHLIFYMVNIIITIFGACIFPLLCMGPRSWMHGMARFWCQCILNNAQWFLRITWKMESFPMLPADQRFLVACAHQSAWETLALNIALKKPAFILKHALMKVPILGWYFRCMDMIPIRREGIVSKAFLNHAQRVSSIGRPIVIFPQGKRETFEKSVRCHRGIFFLYQKLNLPVLAISINSGLFWPARHFFKTAGCITMKGHALIAPGLDETTFMHQLSTLLQEGNRSLQERNKSLILH